MEGLSRGNLEHYRYQITTMEVIELQALAEGDPSLPAGSVPYVRAVLSQQNQEVHKHFDETFNWMPTTGRSRATQTLDADGKSLPGPALQRISSKVKASCSKYATGAPKRAPEVPECS